MANYSSSNLLIAVSVVGRNLKLCSFAIIDRPAVDVYCTMCHSSRAIGPSFPSCSRIRPPRIDCPGRVPDAERNRGQFNKTLVGHGLDPCLLDLPPEPLSRPGLVRPELVPIASPSRELESTPAIHISIVRDHVRERKHLSPIFLKLYLALLSVLSLPAES